MLGSRTVAPMTAEIARRRLLDGRELVVIDVGAREGAHPVWQSLGDEVRIIGFEPDEKEAARLSSQHPRDDRSPIYEPLALGARRERRTFYRARFSAGSGFYCNEALMARVANAANVALLDAVTVSAIDLDSYTRERGIASVDFIKLDVEGAELEILEGARRTLAAGPVLGVEAEVRFHKLPPEAPTFCELDAFLNRQGLRLFDLDPYRFARTALPMPPLYDFRDEHSQPVPGPTTSGQILTGDALFLRDPIRDGRPNLAVATALKLACLYELHGLADCAAELLLAYRDTLRGEVDVDGLLDLLTPVNDEAVRYPAYLEHARRFDAAEGRIYGPNYHLYREAWRQYARSRDTPLRGLAVTYDPPGGIVVGAPVRITVAAEVRQVEIAWLQLAINRAADGAADGDWDIIGTTSIGATSGIATFTWRTDGMEPGEHRVAVNVGFVDGTTVWWYDLPARTYRLAT